ncbi:uncharacterized protein LOC133837260 isoform X1 [Drosophila sulfurigaster albostrigata]|uniref:uncharacterized protein LOC133837260 isoform X1 n=1 Tax=Drosophila sulfurigaster albostrigata TaxID=89887 RepID=UPI002D21ABE8|nr:uncharacterized protein LOC133837260 isoform X1 [Drosophila sulfurigaster albostrigata]
MDEHDMDLTKVYVVRSAKGVDMLCVDDYLYHFDRIGKNNTYRWLCNRRKDKVTPCRSRISTIVPNSQDKTTHIVVEVMQGHVHARCSDHEITKVSQRKRLSNMKMNDAYSTTQPKRARLFERASAGLNPPEWISTSGDNDSQQYSFHLDFEQDKDRVYMLRRRDGRVMVCIDGHLYYLAGKSYKGDMYRWTCVRKRDIECTAKICTEATLAGAHRLHAMESDAHIHPHYSADKLMQMFTRHQILLVDDDQTVEVLQECPNLEYFDPEVSFETQVKTDDVESMIIEDCEDTYEVYSNVDNEDVSGSTQADQQQDQSEVGGDEEMKWPNAADIIDNYVAPADYDPLTETDLTKFTFLPSAKGRKVLCLDRHLFHFDSQSRVNGHLFFTCIMRRDKQQSCHVRVTIDPTENGPEVLRINGEHTHKPDLQEIQRRMNQPKNKGKNSSSEEVKQEQDESANNSAEFESQDEEDFDETEGSGTGADQDSNYEPPKSQAASTRESRRSVVMKKVIGIDGIKMEPEQNKAASMIVQYMDDGADNISAQIKILPNALENLEGNNTSTPKPQLTNARKRRTNTQNAPTPSPMIAPIADMDLTKICTLRSAKGSEMLCVDGYIYHAKNRGLISRNYWVCIKCRDPEINCKSRISTATQKDGTIRVLRVYNSHNHPFSEDDIKRRLFNEINKKNNKKLKFRPLHFIGKSLEQIKQEFGDLAVERLNVSNLTDGIVVHKKPRNSSQQSAVSPTATATRVTKAAASSKAVEVKREEQEQEFVDDDVLIEEEEEEEGEETTLAEDSQYMTIEEDNTDAIIEVVEEVADMDGYGIEPIYTMKLYAVSDGPPSLAVRMTLKALDIQYQLVNVDYCALEHRTEDYAKMNPQKEIPVLDDDGFHLSESIAIMQYLCDKYSPLSTLYPEDPNERALVNQRLCFNMGFYYAPISAHSMAPIFFDYERTPMSQKKVENALEVFETYLQRLGTKYAASDNVTIADFALVSSTLCLEAIDFDLSPYPLVQKWYATFKAEYPELWAIANSGMQEINAFEHNPPDLSHMEHPFHPTRKNKA